MRRTIFIMLILSLLACNLSTYAQRAIEFHLGTAIPISNFRNEESITAGVGLNGHTKYNYPIGKLGLGIYGSIDFCYNPLAEAPKDKMKRPC